MVIAQQSLLNHPCYNHDAHYKVGRIHLPVAQKCNISCNYCNRKVSTCLHTHRPGLSSKLLAPIQCVKYVENVIAHNPAISVIGIAGPGEPLYNIETFQTLELVGSRFPQLKLCVCSNGLLLPDKISILKDLGVTNITITINAFDTKIGAKINRYSIYNGNKLFGEEANELLIRNQLRGLELASKLGILTKVNTILIPEINLDHIEEIAYAIKMRNAYIMNIMPLIPLGKFKNMRPPTCEEIQFARDKCERIIPQFRLCKQCRADACGIPGYEKTQE